MKNFESFLAPQLNEFILYRQTLGYSTKPTRSHLMRFDRYVKEKAIKPGVLQPSFFLQFRDDLKLEPITINNLLSRVRIFFKYMVRTGYYAQNPLKDIPPVPERSFATFVFSPEQTENVLSAACKKIRKDPKYYLKDLSEYVAIVIIARCGLRIRESLRLQVKHYRDSERTIYIEKTKFNKDRLIPVPKSVAGELYNYLSVRQSLIAGDKNPYLLVRNEQKGLSDQRIRFVFHRAVHDIGIERSRQVVGQMIFASPTPHSLRHSFAINTLKRIKERGDCPQHALPVLAAYMGHQIYQHTAKYLKFIDSEQRQAVYNFAISQKENL